jgi:riboflavin kinase / FMN adenylyltransferase
MKIYTTLEKHTEPTAVALGYFDGLHIGHKKVIETTVELKNHGMVPTVFTFLHSPKAVLAGIPEQSIITLNEKKELLKRMGVEALYVVDFSKICKLSPDEFVRDILVEKLNAKTAVCGFNYHFGYGGCADAEDLKALCLKYGIKAKVIKPVLYQREPISSTRIKEALESKDISNAKNMLGN